MPLVPDSNLQTDTMCRFGMTTGGQGRWWKMASPRPRGMVQPADAPDVPTARAADRQIPVVSLSHRFQDFIFDLFHEAGELALFQTERMLSKARLFSGDMPVWHPAVLFACA